MTRYQVVNISLPAGTLAGTVRKTVELYKETRRCVKAYVVGDINGIYGGMYLTLKDNINNHINRLSLNFLIGSISNGSEVNIPQELYLYAAGKRFEIELEHSAINKDMNISVVFELDYENNIPENNIGYYQKTIEIPASASGIYKTPLFNIPSNYKRIIGLRVEGYKKSVKGSVTTFLPLTENTHNISLRTESELIVLDFVPQKILQPQISNRILSQKFFSANIPVSDALSIWFDKIDTFTYVNDFSYEATFLLTKDV